MARDTLSDYLGKMVKIEVRKGEDEHPYLYMGKVSGFDDDFITLNPYIYGHPMSSPSMMYQVKEFYRKLAAGATNKQITLGRRTVESIEELVFDE